MTLLGCFLPLMSHFRKSDSGIIPVSVFNDFGLLQ